MLRIPLFLSTVLKSFEAWDEGARGGGDHIGLGDEGEGFEGGEVKGQSDKEGKVGKAPILSPGDAVALLTALLLAAAPLPASSLESPFASLLECLQSALTRADTGLSTSPPTARPVATMPPSEGGDPRGEPDGYALDNLEGKKNLETRDRGSRLSRRALCPEDLLASLKLLTGEGAGLLRSVSGRGKAQGGTQGAQVITFMSPVLLLLLPSLFFALHADEADRRSSLDDTHLVTRVIVFIAIDTLL